MSDCPFPKSGVTRWFARIGLAGFVFFLVKGLLWLAVPALIVAFKD